MSSIENIRREILSFRELCEARSERSAGIQRLELPLANIDPIQALRKGSGFERMHWSNRDNSEVVVGFGVADLVENHSNCTQSDIINTVHSRLEFADGNVRFYGGCAFDFCSELSAEWGEFGKSLFIVPLIEIISRNDSFYVAYNYTLGDILYLESIIDTVFSDSTPEVVSVENNIVSKISLPERAVWCENVNTMLSVFDTELTKVVPARKSVITTEVCCDSISLAQALYEHNHSTYNFYFELDPGTVFMGASPECLFTRDGSLLYCEAIAGTSYQGTVTKLEHSAKDQKEHAIVHHQLERDMNHLCSNFSVAQVCQELELSELTHLISSFSGDLRAGVSDAAIMSKLHPTAAVCGESRCSAMDLLREIDPFCRGWYSGSIGWISKGKTEFAVAIRSALINGSVISLFAGAGVVEGSDPDLEWYETTRKMDQFLSLLTK